MPVRKIDPRRNNTLRLLLYGTPGSGKTWIAATAAADPRTQPALHIDIGGNATSDAMADTVPDIVAIDDLDGLQTLWAWLSRGMPANDRLVRDVGLRTDYRTVILDGISEIHRQSLARSSGSEELGLQFPAQFQLQHYNPALHHITTIAHAFFEKLSVRQHVIVTALELPKDENGITRYIPQLAGAAASSVMGYAYNVGRVVDAQKGNVRAQVEQLAKQQGTRREQIHSITFFRPIGQFEAKDQHGTGITAMLDMTVGKFMDRWEKRLDAVRDPSVEDVEQ